MHVRVRAALLQDPPGVAHVPVVGVELQRDQLVVGQLLQVDRRGLGVLVGDLEDAAVGAVVAVRVAMMAGVGVVPVDHVHLAVGAVLQVEDLRPAIAGQAEIGGPIADVARALGRQQVLVEPLAVDVVHEDLVAILRPASFRPGRSSPRHARVRRRPRRSGRCPRGACRRSSGDARRWS